MATATHKVVFTRKGNEMSTTAMYPYEKYDPAVWTPERLAEEGTFCWSNDDWRLVEAKLYSVVEVELPEWLTVEEWLPNNIKWKYVFGFCKDGQKTTLPENFLRYLLTVESDSTKLTLAKLMETKNFRSAFRKSMREQVENFLATPPAARQYPSPLSHRQLEAIAPPNARYDARSISNFLYRGY